MRDDLPQLREMLEEKEKVGNLSLMSKEKLDKQRAKQQEDYENNVLPALLSLAKKKHQIYFKNGGKITDHYESLDEKIQTIIEGTPSPWKEMAKKRVKVQQLFDDIKHDLATLTYWNSGNPWILLSIRGNQTLVIGFAKKANKKELRDIKSGKFKGQWIRYKSQKDNEWVTITPIPEHRESPIVKKLFHMLHKLRIACREIAQQNK